MGTTGSVALTIKINVKGHTPGTATLTLKATTPNGVIVAKRFYHYVVYNS